MIDPLTKAKFKLAIVKNGLKYFSDFAKMKGIDVVKFNQFLVSPNVHGVNKNSGGEDWEKLILDYIAESEGK